TRPYAVRSDGRSPCRISLVDVPRCVRVRCGVSLLCHNCQCGRDVRRPEPDGLRLEYFRFSRYHNRTAIAPDRPGHGLCRLLELDSLRQRSWWINWRSRRRNCRAATTVLHSCGVFFHRSARSSINGEIRCTEIASADDESLPASAKMLLNGGRNTDRRG